MAWLEKAVKKGSANALGMLLLMKAMQLSTKPTYSDVLKIREAFEVAVVSIAIAGFKSVAAIANERTGEAMERHGDPYWARYYIRQAHKFYWEWGAFAKADQLASKHPEALSEISGSFGRDGSGGNILGRQRFDDVQIEPKQLVPA